jgi:hypothetical protein
MSREFNSVFALVGAVGLFATSAHATLSLTPTGTSDGFTLTPFVSGYNFGATYGPLSQAILPDGNVITGSVGDHNIYVFPNANGQTLGSAISATPYTCQTGNCNWAMAAAGGNAYGAQAFGGTYERFWACLQLTRERMGIGRRTFCVSDRRGIPESANV